MASRSGIRHPAANHLKLTRRAPRRRLVFRGRSSCRGYRLGGIPGSSLDPDILGRPVGPVRRPTSPWLVYLLRCSDGSLYTGITNDLPKRLKAHAAGKASRYTRSRLPVRQVYSEPQRSKSAALKREAAIKRLRRAEKDRLVAKR